MHISVAHQVRARLVLEKVGNATKAEDLPQDIFLQVFRNMHTFRGEAAFSTWLHRLAVNIVLMRSNLSSRHSLWLLTR
jgi:DNA-directed RNA polymerase specialized sigma24 family protein